MKPKVLEMAEKPDGSFVFTAINEERPDILYAFDNVRLLQKEGTDEVYIEHELVVSTTKDTNTHYTEEYLKDSGEQLLQQLWNSVQ